ncbi:FtsX-like permease family protein [Eshraghiella crossota]
MEKYLRMRITDSFELSKWELKIGIKEYVLSILIQGLLLVCILFSIGMIVNMDCIVDGFYKKNNSGGYEFELTNFDMTDKEWLLENGFCDLGYEDNRIIFASIDSIQKMWTKKIYALIKGKDIWSESTDKILEMILFAKIIILFLILALIILLICNLSNAIELKMIERKKYMKIISNLGMNEDDIKSVFYIYFLCRMLIIILIAEVIYFCMNYMVNNYVVNNMKIQVQIPFFNMYNSFTALIIFTITFFVSLRKVSIKNEG